MKFKIITTGLELHQVCNLFWDSIARKSSADPSAKLTIN